MWTTSSKPNGRTLPVAALAARALLLAAAGCGAPEARSPPVLDPAKVASVVVGRSSRADVFGVLGRPSRTERSGRGEAWIYEATQGGTRQGVNMGGIAAASGVVGAFVPYVGLVGPGLGLAGAAMDGRPPETEAATLAVAFGEDGIVRDCIFTSTAAPAGMPGAATAAAADCRRPVPDPRTASPPPSPR